MKSLHYAEDVTDSYTCTPTTRKS